MEVFVFYSQCVYEYEESSSMGVFSTKEKAKAKFDEFVSREKKNVECDGWIIDLTEDEFEAYPEGYYAENRIRASIHTMEVQ